MARKNKAFPQMIVAEVLLAVVTAGLCFAILHKAGAAPGLAGFFGGVAADRVLILAFRHLNKPVRRKPAARKSTSRPATSGRRS